jgi:hypothetical protein
LIFQDKIFSATQISDKKPVPDEHGCGTVVLAAIVPAHSDGFVPESHRVPYYPRQVHFGLRAPEGQTANFDLDVNEAPPPVNGFFSSTGFPA